MSKLKKNKTYKKIKQALVSVFILLIFIVPVFTTVQWLKVVAFGNDPRKVMHIKGAEPKTLDGLRPFSEPLISITFDDGWESIYSEAFSTLEKYGVKTTQYILGDEFNNTAYMSEGQIKSLQKAGHEIASHTMSHPKLTELDNEDLVYELKQSKELLQQKFGSIHDFATPLGAYNQAVTAEVQKYYRSHRNTDADPADVDYLDVNTREKFDQYNIIAYTIRRTTTLEDLRKLIEYTEANNGWLVLTYHQIDSSDAHFGVTKETFEEHIKLIASGNSRLPTISQVLDIIAPVKPTEGSL